MSIDRVAYLAEVLSRPPDPDFAEVSTEAMTEELQSLVGDLAGSIRSRDTLNPSGALRSMVDIHHQRIIQVTIEAMILTLDERFPGIASKIAENTARAVESLYGEPDQLEEKVRAEKIILELERRDVVNQAPPDRG